MTKPVDNIVTCGFGVRGSHWAAGYHTGRDYRARTPVTVKATTSGKVVFAGLHGGWGADYGNHVIIDTDGIRHIYAHLSKLSVRAGQRVAGGTRVGYSGHTGNAPAPHLHYEERHSPYTYWDHRSPKFDLQAPLKPAVSLELLQAALRRAKREGKSTRVPNGRLVKKALRTVLGSRYGMVLTSNYIGTGTVKAYADLQRKWYPSADADGIAGKVSLARLGLKGGFRVV